MSTKSSRRGQMFVAIGMLVIGVVGLFQVYFAVAHHGLVFADFARFGAAWITPSQGALAFGLLTVIGLALLLTTLRKERR